MAADVDWDTCAEDDCLGVRLPSGGKCWAHADDADQALERLHDTGQLDARGVPITKELLQRLLAAAPKSDYGQPVLTNPRFDRATFKGKATFKGGPGFYGAIFKGTASFGGATFEGTAWFGGATFEGDAGFYRAIFEGDAAFHSATFKGRAWFDWATFKGEARFVEARFRGDAEFDRAIFHGDAWFNGARVKYDAHFLGATFQHARQLGPMLVRESLVLDQAIFHERVQIEISATALCCRQTHFLAGVQLRVRWAQIVLDDADLAAPSILAGVPLFPGLDEGRWGRAVERLRRPTRVLPGRPRVLSLRRADVAGLTMSNVDLRACRFADTHNLDKLRVEESNYGYTPHGWWWTVRRVIAEEHHWRSRSGITGTSDPEASNTIGTGFQASNAARRARDRLWYGPTHSPPAWLQVEQPTPEQIAALYRALRKGREDSKDEPGAADFYFGEMEMRRQARREQARQARRDRTWRTWAAARSEHAILWLYWLAAGYGLRASRALATFLAVLVVAAGLFAFGGGFASSATATAVSPTTTTRPSSPGPPSADTTATVDTSFGGALVYSARTVIGLTRDPQPRLTRFGDVVQILLRILGPVLLGLAVLSVRGRVKR
jgi:uncharacterized protein YjbI with pentapeptide repeats